MFLHGERLLLGGWFRDRVGLSGPQPIGSGLAVGRLDAGAGGSHSYYDMQEQDRAAKHMYVNTHNVMHNVSNMQFRIILSLDIHFVQALLVKRIQSDYTVRIIYTYIPLDGCLRFSTALR